MNIKSILRKVAYGYKAESSSYIEHLRSIGMKIGSDCIIYVPTKTLIDEQYPWMITIGKHVRITEGVKILTHDYAWSVLKTEKGAILGASGTVKIGDNVFIGMNTVITRNVEIGNNVIIGAGSVVTSNCDHNGVYAGVPAKERNKRAETLLKEFGLFSERKKRPSQISGGQQQRAAIARALVNHPRYLFADEPTGNLDEENTRRVMELFQELNQKGIGILMVTHDTAVAECAQRIVKMEQGILVSQSV